MERNTTQASVTLLQNLGCLSSRRDKLEAELRQQISKLTNCQKKLLSTDEKEELLRETSARDWQVYRDEFELLGGCRPNELNVIKAPTWGGDWEVGALLGGSTNYQALPRNKKKAAKQLFKHHATHNIAHQRHRQKNHYTLLALRLVGIMEDAYGSSFPLIYSDYTRRYSGLYLTVLWLAMRIHLYSTSLRGKPSMNDLANLIRSERAKVG